MKNGRRKGQVKRQEITGDGLFHIQTFDDTPEYTCRLRQGTGRGRGDRPDGRPRGNPRFCQTGAATIITVEEYDDDNVFDGDFRPGNRGAGGRRKKRMAAIITDSDTGMVYDINLDGAVIERHVSDFPDEEEPLTEDGVPLDYVSDLGSDFSAEQDEEYFDPNTGRLLLLRSSFPAGTGATSSTSTTTSHRSLQDTSLVFVDILVIWTEAMEAAAGSPQEAQARVDLAVESFNAAAQNSGVYTRLNLVHSEKDASGYVETGSVSDALTAVQNPNDGQMDYVHGLRDSKGGKNFRVHCCNTMS